MRFRPALICCAVVALACSIESEASASRRARAERPANTTTNTNTILPSREEVAAVPVPEQGRIAAYPVDVVRYGLTVHPGARLTRRIMGR